MRSRKIRPRYLMLGGLIGIGCGIAVTELCGQHPFHDRAAPRCILNYPCLPRRETWGYYPPRWRRWPEAPALVEPAPGEIDADLPEIDIPTPEEEERRSPVPTTRTVPLEAAPTPTTEVPTPAAPGPGGLRPFSPTPAAEPPADGPGADLPGGPLRSAPVPTTPFPDGVPNGTTPRSAPTPSPLNPFDGAEADASRFEEDPPPALPPSLRSARRMRDVSRSAQQQNTRREIPGLARLPRPSSASGAPERYAVQQASATVWASGTEDVRPTDANAGRVQQAIHHEPID